MSPVHDDVDGIKCLGLRALCRSACLGSARFLSPAHSRLDHAHNTVVIYRIKQTQLRNETTYNPVPVQIRTSRDVDEEPASSDDDD